MSMRLPGFLRSGRVRLIPLLVLLVHFCAPLAGAARLPADPARDPGPGLHRYRIRPESLPKPYATPSAVNPPRVVARPDHAILRAPPGFTVIEAAADFRMPRQMHLLPNGDLLLAESEIGQITLLRDADGDGRFEFRSPWVRGLDQPFGLALAEGFVYVGEIDRIIRFPWTSGESRAPGDGEVVVPTLTPRSSGGHWTRNLLWDPKERVIYVAVGSLGNVEEDEPNRAAILRFRPGATIPPGGFPLAIHASGLRNPVGLTLDPATGALWTCVNERDGLGDDLVPDYATKVEPGGFYGWPYAYIGRNPQPGFAEKRPDLVLRSLVPDVLFEAHSAALGIVFYNGTAFPPRYRGGAFVTHHGSWNRKERVGYRVVYLPFSAGRATGEYEDFLVGWSDPGAAPRVWGRPVGVLVDRDGSLLVSDDGGDRIWRIRYDGPAR